MGELDQIFADKRIGSMDDVQSIITLYKAL